MVTANNYQQQPQHGVCWPCCACWPCGHTSPMTKLFPGDPHRSSPLQLTLHPSKMSGKTPMTPTDAARIQAAEAKQGGGGVEKGSFAARAQVGTERVGQCWGQLQGCRPLGSFTQPAAPLAGGGSGDGRCCRNAWCSRTPGACLCAVCHSVELLATCFSSCICRPLRPRTWPLGRPQPAPRLAPRSEAPTA